MTPRSNSEVPYHQAPSIKKRIPQMCSIAHLRGGKGGAKYTLCKEGTTSLDGG